MLTHDRLQKVNEKAHHMLANSSLSPEVFGWVASLIHKNNGMTIIDRILHDSNWENAFAEMYTTYHAQIYAPIVTCPFCVNQIALRESPPRSSPQKNNSIFPVVRLGLRRRKPDVTRKIN
jgi:hypothetical protein